MYFFWGRGRGRERGPGSLFFISCTCRQKRYFIAIFLRSKNHYFIVSKFIYSNMCIQSALLIACVLEAHRVPRASSEAIGSMIARMMRNSARLFCLAGFQLCRPLALNVSLPYLRVHLGSALALDVSAMFLFGDSAARAPIIFRRNVVLVLSRFPRRRQCVHTETNQHCCAFTQGLKMPSFVFPLLPFADASRFKCYYWLFLDSRVQLKGTCRESLGGPASGKNASIRLSR